MTYWPGPRAREEIRRLPRQQPLLAQLTGETREEMAQPLGDQLPEYQPPEPDVTTPGKQLRIRRPKEKPAIKQAEEEQDGMRHALEAFGVSKGVARKLTRSYPEDYVLDKLELAQWLADTGSSLVAKNPAGWLRKAIEEDYAPPRNYQTSGEKEAKITHAAARERRVAEEEYRRLKAETKAHLLEQYPPKPVGEEGLTTESVWNLTLKILKEQVPPATHESRLKETMLVDVTEQAAKITVPNAFTINWLERRLYGHIRRAMTGVLGREVDLQFIAAT